MADDSSSQRGSRTSHVPHPDSPAGHQFDWVSSPFPHPASPSGQRFGWSSLALPHPDSPLGKLRWRNRMPDKLAAEVAGLEAALAEAAAGIKISLIDASLRLLYQRLIDRINSIYVPGSSLRFTKDDGAVLLEKLGRPVLWFDPQLQRKLQQSSTFSLSTDRVGVIWEFGTVKEKKELLNDIQALQKSVYNAAANAIEQQWEKAKRAGKQQELVKQWKTQLLREIKALSTGVGTEHVPIESPQTQASAAAAKAAAGKGAGAGSGAGSKTKELHWIGVKVLDDTGKSVKDIAVQCKLDDGTVLSVDFSTATLAADGSYKTEKVLDATKGDFSFPSLFDVEWWPQGGSGGKSPSAIPAPAAASGDCLLSIADSLGFRNYHSVWDQPQNDALKKDRPNPNMLAAGDIVQAPDKMDKVVRKAVDQTWTFVVRSKRPFKIRMVLIDKNDKPLSGKSWELTTPLSQKGTTGGDGLIEITGLQPSDKAGTIIVTMAPAAPPQKKKEASAPPSVNPPPYPPAIVPADFKDPAPAPVATEQKIEWDLSIGALPAVKVKEGALARLHNLGFGCSVDSADPQATQAVKAYQLFYLKNKNGSGVTSDIQDDAAKRHDNP